MAIPTNSKSLSWVLLAALVSVSIGCNGSSGDRASVEQLPDVVFDGGGGKLSLELEVNQPAVLKASFAQYDDEGESQREIDVVEEIRPGTLTRRVDVSPGTYVYFELGVHDASVGAELNWVVRLDGQEVQRESDRLSEPLESGYAFFLQFEADDVKQVSSWIR